MAVRCWLLFVREVRCLLNEDVDVVAAWWWWVVVVKVETGGDGWRLKEWKWKVLV